MAVGTEHEVDACQPEQSLPPGQIDFRVVFRLGRPEKLPCCVELGVDVSCRKQTVVTDADESSGEDVQQEASNEFLGRQAKDLLSIVVGVVTVMELDFSMSECDQTMVGDGRTVGVAAEIAEDVIGSTERRFGVDQPLGAVEPIE